MRVVIFCHTLRSDWNHGNAHFLRGICTELQERGCDVHVWEPRDAWSMENLKRDHGDWPLHAFAEAYPSLSSHVYDPGDVPLDEALQDADLILVHEWNEPALVAEIGRRRQPESILLFHDTHHRCVTDPAAMSRYDLSRYDGVLAFGESVAETYRKYGWGRRVFVWHEAADTRVFYPTFRLEDRGDLVWIGNWGDDERAAELKDFLFDPVRALGLRARIHGVRYPAQALDALRAAGIEYGGWLPNFEAPAVFAQYRFTVHVPRRPYAMALPGVPTIRVFEALACGIPLISAPWQDAEGLFTPGEDFLVAHDGDEMKRQMRALLDDPALSESLVERGLAVIRSRHTCAHRVSELMKIVADLGGVPEPEPALAAGEDVR